MVTVTPGDEVASLRFDDTNNDGDPEFSTMTSPQLVREHRAWRTTSQRPSDSGHNTYHDLYCVLSTLFVLLDVLELPVQTASRSPVLELRTLKHTISPPRSPKRRFF